MIGKAYERLSDAFLKALSRHNIITLLEQTRQSVYLRLLITTVSCFLTKSVLLRPKHIKMHKFGFNAQIHLWRGEFVNLGIVQPS